MINALKPLIFATVGLALSACSIRSELFIQNRSANDLLVTVTYTMPLADFARKEANMDYLPKICKPKQYRKDEQAIPLTFTHRSDSTLSMLIPASSTARIERSYNFIYVQHIREITFNGKRLTIDELIDASRNYRGDRVYVVD